jgi:putative redox protein
MNNNASVMALTKETKDVHEVTTNWQNKVQFISDVNEHLIYLDKVEMHGGTNKGPRPKSLILAAAGGCMGMEIVSLTERCGLI